MSILKKLLESLWKIKINLANPALEIFDLEDFGLSNGGINPISRSYLER